MVRKRYEKSWLPRLRRIGWSVRVRWDRFRSRWSSRSKARSSPASDATASMSLQGKFCPAPFMQVDLEESGTCYTCCSAWLPTPMGNVAHAPLEDLWNGPVMQQIRASIYDGSFRYCRQDRCPKIQNGELPDIGEVEDNPHYGQAVAERRTELQNLPVTINLVNDRSCNLFCPSCRPERIQVGEGKTLEKMQALQDGFLGAWLKEPNDLDFTLSITGSGDPFASHLYRELLYGLKGEQFPNMKIALQTNGVLLTPRNWARMAGVHGNIASVIVSIDAASPETYAVTRRGGNWDLLMANCARLGELRRAGKIRLLRYDFVVQKANFEEMPAFVSLAEKLGGDQAYFSRLVDWGTWPKKVFEEQCVWDAGHPLQARFLQVMGRPELGAGNVDLGNMTEFRNDALRRGLGAGDSITI